ncbi:hypothetical protein AVU42_gp013 [Prochlorococcus phage P-TIM68]|uniref:Uncharacterized protein n=1 Tax=Prochlorococcus phage P-TIM68 TaxID=1542477 RepID=A0A0K0KWB8_9CAUD|nr:hypothetical protein AVU42_gp013 [Prochlorococcus phage P-TIM68]AIR93399.1 hypothetical protein [Prochlorococcus phage P-TIM68]
MALNFLVTGVKMLAKKMSKKKMKEGAKKFVGGKEEKRAKVEKIMEKEGSYGAPKEKISPTKLLNMPEVPDVKPATGNKIDFKLLGDRLDNIVGMTDALGFLTKTQADQKKEEIKLLELKNAKEAKKKREAKLEKKDSLLGKASKGVKKATKGPLDFMQNFLVKMALGGLVVFLLANADKIRKLFKDIGENIEKFGKLLRVGIFGFKEGMKLANKGIKLLGKGAKKMLSPISKAFKAIGGAITGAFSKLGSKFVKILSKIPGVGFIKNLASGVVKTVSTAGKVVSNVASKASSITSTATKEAGKVSKMVTKFFGPKVAKAVSKAGKVFKVLKTGAKAIKIPVLGPIIVAVTSLLAGDPIGQVLFKSLGAALGGVIGGLLPLPVPGNPLAMLVGELLGEFIGNFFYEMFLGEGKGKSGKFLKDSFMKLVSGVGKGGKMFLDFVMSMLGKLGNFFKDGFKRFTEDFPTINIPEGGGVQTTLGKVANLLGLSKESKYMENGRLVKVPNLALLTPIGMPFLLPHLKNSFFPSGEKEQVPDSETSVSKTEETDETTSAVVTTEDNSETIAESTDVSGGSGGESTAKLGEKDTSSVASTTSSVSTQASYEEVASGTVILEAPKRGDFASGSGGDAQFQRAMMLHQDQKAMLNSYFKTQVTTNLYKI